MLFALNRCWLVPFNRGFAYTGGRTATDTGRLLFDKVVFELAELCSQYVMFGLFSVVWVLTRTEINSSSF